MNNNKPSIKKLSADLQDLIEAQVETLVNRDQPSKQVLASLSCELHQIIDDAKHNKDDFQEISSRG